MVTPVPQSTVANSFPSGTMVGVKLTDGDDLLLEKLRESTVGEYEVRGLLGRGGMASVFVAYDLALNRKVALKVMHPGLLGDSGMRERFRLEARLAARLDHSNIVTVHAVKERANIVFFDLKLIDGTSLDRLIRNRTEPFPPRVARWATAKIAEALHYAHGEGVVHRDMKPANVMVERRGDCVVTDFGIAKAAESPHLTQTGAVVGTPAYMSPEQCLGHEITAASDQYSLGILAYEMFTGVVPFTGSMLTIQLGHVEKIPPAPNTINPDIPQASSDVVMRMIAKDPKDRWPTLADAAEAMLEGLGATDSQMRRELAVLVASLPDDEARPSLPATPRSPTPATLPASDFTQPVVAAARVVDAATELMPLTPARPTPAMSRRTIGVPRVKQRMLVLLGMAAVSIVIVAVIALSGGKNTPTAAAPRDTTTQAERNNVLGAGGSAPGGNLEMTDTVITRVGVNPITKELRVGDSVQIVATIYGAGGDALQHKVRWSSSDSALVIVSGAGWIHAMRKSGTSPVFITASAGKKDGVAAITVK